MQFTAVLKAPFSAGVAIFPSREIGAFNSKSYTILVAGGFIPIIISSSHYYQQKKETAFTTRLILFTVAPVPLSAGERDAISTASVPFIATTAHFSAAIGDAINRKSKIHL